MNELYWITRFDGILAVIIIPMVILLIVGCVLFFASYDCSEYQQKRLRKSGAICGSIGIFLLILQAFIPTTNQALIIYGVGETIDYIKSNEKAKQLPDKAIIALDKYLESINKETEKSGNH